jgi:hypothetical protein
MRRWRAATNSPRLRAWLVVLVSFALVGSTFLIGRPSRRENVRSERTSPLSDSSSAKPSLTTSTANISAPTSSLVSSSLPDLALATVTLPTVTITVPDLPIPLPSSTSTVSTTTVPTRGYDSLDISTWITLNGDYGDYVTLFLTAPNGVTTTATKTLAGGGPPDLAFRVHNPFVGTYTVGLRFVLQRGHGVDASVLAGRTYTDQTHDDSWSFLYDFFPEDYSKISAGETVVQTEFNFPP